MRSAWACASFRASAGVFLPTIAASSASLKIVVMRWFW